MRARRLPRPQHPERERPSCYRTGAADPASWSSAELTATPPPTPAAVLVPLFRDDKGELRLLLVVRGALGRHAHQLSLPGGKHEPGDASLLETALRETEEEIGVTRAEIEVIAALPPIDTRTTGFRVHPYLARIHPPESWRLAQGEITAVITPRVSTLADPSLRREQLLSYPSWPEPRRVRCLELEGGYLLWGLTLRLLETLLPRLMNGEFAL
jgi:8-oxo-dGTP pyrophosphatase MutT (NUDIX family)